MTEGRRHSVDIPISRTLISLRRVRSLRDPSTNSMSKFSALLDNVNWETNSTSAISLRFEKGCKECSSDHNGLVGSKFFGFNGLKEGQDDDLQVCCSSGNSKLVTCQNLGWVESAGTPNRIKQVEQLDNYLSNGEDVHRNGSLSESYCINCTDKGLEMSSIMPSIHPMEDVGSCNGSIVGSPLMDEINQSASKLKHRYKNKLNLYAVADAIGSHISTPCPYASDVLSNHGTSLFVDEEVDFDHSQHGCGLSYCWTRTPRSRESNPSIDVEDHPLLSGEVGEITPYGQMQHKDINNETTYLESPRSLSQKFKPKFFEELVGQNAVVRSLLSAISRGMVTSFYLFHGPRGTGKSSASRIFAAALNCLSREEQKPCGLCRECTLFFSGRCRDVKEVDSVRINRSGRVRSLIKKAIIPPSSSRFKIFIVDECQLLRGETWATVLNNLENISQHVVFVMITPDLDKLPRSAVSRSQKYHFPKIKDTDIASRLRKICIEESLIFDQDALDFIAAKSSGSLRDAEMMLDQLSLLGKKITISLAYELIGIVSDDELLDLLDLALSSDTSNTVIRARELMRSKIDPMQLLSQLANLIMDILVGKGHEDCSEARKKFFGKHTSEADMQKLSHALKVLFESEKQLRTSKHQTTWLTVALLQLSSVESSSLDLNDSKLCLRNAHDKGSDFHCTMSPGESLKHLGPCSCDDNKSNKLVGREDFKGTLESLWQRAVELCQSNSLKNFLRKQGKLSSLDVNQGLAVAELEFHHPDHISRAEKSWKLIASSFQSILGCNVEIRLLCTPIFNHTKIRKPSFRLFSCSQRMRQKSLSTAEYESDSEHSDYISEKPMIKDGRTLTCSSGCGSQKSHKCCHRTEVIRAFRNSERNVLSTGVASSYRSVPDDTSKTPAYGINSVKGNDCECKVPSKIQEPENQPSCFPRALRLQKKLRASDTSEVVCTSNQLALSIPAKTSLDTYICVDDPYVFYGSSSNYTNSFRDEDRSAVSERENSDVPCSRTSTFPLKKAWQMAHQQKRSSIVEYILPCTSAKYIF